MTDLLVIIFPMLLVDILSPVLLAAMIFAAGSARPVLNSGAILMGHTLAYLAVGLLISYGVDALAERFEHPRPADFLFEFLLGLACLYGAFAVCGGSASTEHNPKGELTPGSCLLYGMVINVVGAPFALPYVAVISQILDAELSLTASMTVLLGYNVAYAAPFTLVPLSVLAMGDEARPILERVNGWMARGADLLMPWLLFALGLFLLTDVALYWLTGEPLPIG